MTATTLETSQSDALPTGAKPSKPIIFFDGVCGMCNAFVDFVISRDKEGKFLFAPLQGETAREQLPAEFREDLKTMVYSYEGRHWVHSSGVIRILWKMGGFWSFCGTLMWLVPGPIRNFGYKCVARWRYKIFGKQEACRMPTPEERSRILE